MPQSVNYVDAGLAKRLAEAADSFRDSLYHYFICKTGYPYDLWCTAGYESDEDASSEADSLKQGLGTEYSKFGPYKTGTDNEPDIEYDSIQLRFMQGENELYCETLTNDTDAVVLSLSAYDKFFQPYYVKLYGIETAADFRTNAIAAFTAPQKQAVRHKGKGKTSSAPNPGGTRLVAGSFDK